jgi:hypothetical protein
MFDGSWWMLTSIINSFVFDKSSTAASNSANQYFVITDLVGNGYSVALTSKLG